MQRTPVNRLAILTAASLVAAAPAAAQSGPFKYTIDPKASLAWWQVNPHLNHLWATTCPQEPSWRPGEGRSMAWAADFLAMRSKTGYANIRDTIIPLYPRKRVRALCTEAVRGEVTAADTVGWRGVNGLITVKGEYLITGLDMRDEYARKAVLQTGSYPDIKFAIDSLSPLTAKGDTLRGTVFGKFTLHGNEQPVSARLKTFHEFGGLRVQAQFMVPANHLTERYGISKFALGLGVGTAIWDELHMGVDVLLRRATP